MRLFVLMALLCAVSAHAGETARSKQTVAVSAVSARVVVQPGPVTFWCTVPVSYVWGDASVVADATSLPQPASVKIDTSSTSGAPYLALIAASGGSCYVFRFE